MRKPEPYTARYYVQGSTDTLRPAWRIKADWGRNSYVIVEAEEFGERAEAVVREIVDLLNSFPSE